MTELEPDDHPGARYALGPWGKSADPFDIVINLSDAGIANDFRTCFNLGIDDPAPINQADTRTTPKQKSAPRSSIC